MSVRASTYKLVPTYYATANATKHTDIIRKVSRDIAPPDVMGTKDGIAALSEFIKESVYPRKPVDPDPLNQLCYTKMDPKQPRNPRKTLPDDDHGQGITLHL